MRLFLATALIALTAALGLTACGRSDTSTAKLAAAKQAQPAPQGPPPPPPGRRWGHHRPPKLSAKTRSCLKSKGITPPMHRRFHRDHRMPKPGTRRHFRDMRKHFRGMRKHFRDERKEHPGMQKRFQKLRKALTACGVKLPPHPPMGGPRPDGPPPGGPPPPGPPPRGY